MRKIVIVGAGGFGRDVLWVIRRANAVNTQFEVVGFCDDAADMQSGEYAGLPLLGNIENVCHTMSDVVFICAVGDNRARKSVFSRFAKASIESVSIIDPTAVIADNVSVADGCFVGVNSVVSVDCRIGSGVIINHNVTVGHDVKIQNFAQLCPGVCVSGGCEIGEGALLGTLAGTIPQRHIGAWATVGAGVTTLRNVAEGTSMIRLGTIAGK
jgi:sugar O-acyltransferase (sialic acid O-acetyltransferase NeuD family)